MIEKKIKVLRLTNKIPHYNLPAYNALGSRVELTIAHWGEYIPDNETNFDQIILTPIYFRSLVFFKENIFKIAKKFDAVLVLSDLHVLSYWLLGFNSFRKYALTFWGIGVSASYEKKIDEDRSLDKIRFYIMNKADSLVFYSTYPIKRYVEDGGMSQDKLFVANNTVQVNERIIIPAVKKYFLFVGTLYKEKKIFDLLEAYFCAHKNNQDIHNLVIVGEGAERNAIEHWIEANNLSSKITLLGAIYDSEKLKDVFRDALVCVSPGQAGLSVLTSMAYGVPFITTEDAITGGEIFNITNAVNGFLYKESIENLTSVLEFVENNPTKVSEMGVAAQNYYFDNRTINQMVDGLYDSLIYAYKTKQHF